MRALVDIGEIARRSGVSRSTVSYALSGKRPVSEATRQRIQSVIDELNYRPNAAARALKEGRTRTLGLVIPPASGRLTFMQLDFVGAVMEAAAAVDLEVLLDDPRVERLQRERMPFVLIGRTAQPSGVLGRHRQCGAHRPVRRSPR